MDGDWIVVRQQHHAETSDIVAAMIEDTAGWEATVKTFEDNGNGVWLIPQNPAYKPIPVTTPSSLAELWQCCGASESESNPFL